MHWSAHLHGDVPLIDFYDVTRECHVVLHTVREREREKEREPTTDHFFLSLLLRAYSFGQKSMSKVQVLYLDFFCPESVESLVTVRKPR